MFKKIVGLLLITLLNSCGVKTFEVKFLVDETTYHIEEVNSGELVSAPEEPSKEGFEFKGWFDENEEQWIFSLNTVTEDKRLTAQFEEIGINVEVSSKKYLVNTLDEFEVFRYETDVEGPTIFIIAGIHGDERAGWMAALQLKDYSYTRGTIYLLPFANNRAITSEPPRRYVGKDLNRSFPGAMNNNNVDLLAITLYNAIKSTNPDLVIDMHESRGSYTDGYLGDQIILEMGLYNLYVSSVISELRKLEIVKDNPVFRIDSAPPVGSINKEFSQREGIPVLTLETNRGNLRGTIADETVPLEKRIAIQLALVDIILKTFTPM